MYEKVYLKLVPKDKSEKLTISPDDIPTLSPREHVEQFMKGDESPFYKIQKIEYPISANEMNYGKEFFASYLSHLKERPIPGSKDGHDMRYGARASTDFVLIGGKMDDKAVYLKNYIPKRAESDNTNFLAELKSDLVHFSVVAYARKEVIQNDDGSLTINVLDCGAQGLRNDAVSYGEGAMAQVTNSDNSRMIGKSISNARKLISGGKINSGSWEFVAADGNKLLGESGDDWKNYALWNMLEITDAEAESKARYKYPYGKNGEVYIEALRNLASRASRQGLTDLSEVASELYDLAKGKSKNKEGHVEPKEILVALKEQTNKLTLKEIAEAMGVSNLLVTKEHEDAVKVVNALIAAGIKDPIAEVTAMKSKIEADKAIVRNAALDTAFGTDPEGKNFLRQYVAGKIPADCADLPKAIEDVKKDTIALKLAGEQADYMSEENKLGKHEGTRSASGVTVMKY